MSTSPATIPIDAPGLGDFRREIAAGGDGVAFSSGGGLLLAGLHDDVLRSFGSRAYELMAVEPGCASALGILIAGALGDGPSIGPAIRRDPNQAVAPSLRSPEADLAEEVAQFNERGLARLDRPVEETLEDWLADGLIHGCSVLEQTYEYVEGGPDAGRLMLRTLAVKPRWAWDLRVDPAMRVVKVRVRTADGRVKDVRREKFGIFTHAPRYRNPLGTSALRSAYNPWNRLVQRHGGLERWLAHFADPSLILTAPEKGIPDAVDPATGRRLTMSQQMLATGNDFKSSSILALPYSATAQLIESKGDGSAYHAANDADRREIYRSTLYSDRAVMEAKNDSRANAESGLDVIAMRINRIRRPLARAFRDDILYWHTRFNFGKDTADRLTPELTFGADDHGSDALVNALANGVQRGLFLYEQLPQLWDKLGVGPPPGGLPPKPEPVAPTAPDPNAKPPNAPKVKP